MKSATRRGSSSRPSQSPAFPDDEGFGIGHTWPGANFLSADESQNDPWTTPVWPGVKQQSEVSWTSTDASGFPTDAFVPSEWPTQEEIHTDNADSRHGASNGVSQRMSDEDWLPSVQMRHEPVSPHGGWGSVAQGNSEETDNWNTDPLSFSQDGNHAPLGTEARPIPVEDYMQQEEVLEERDTEILQEAKKKLFEAQVAAAVQEARRNSTSKSQPPIPDESSQNVSPRKGIMRFFGGGGGGGVSNSVTCSVRQFFMFH